MPLIKYYLNGCKVCENQYDSTTLMSEIDLPNGIYKLDIYDIRFGTHKKYLYIVRYQSHTYFFDKFFENHKSLFTYDDYISESDQFKIYINSASKNLIFYILNFKTENSCFTRYRLENKVLDINISPDLCFSNYYYNIVSKIEYKEEFIIQYKYEIKIIKPKENNISSFFSPTNLSNIKKRIMKNLFG